MTGFMDFILINQRFIMMALLTIFVISAFAMIFSVEAKKDFKALMWAVIVAGFSGMSALLYLFPIKTSIVLMIAGTIAARWIRKVLNARLLFTSIFTTGFFSGVMGLVQANKKWSWETLVLVTLFTLFMALSFRTAKEENEEMHEGEEELELTE